MVAATLFLLESSCSKCYENFFKFVIKLCIININCVLLCITVKVHWKLFDLIMKNQNQNKQIMAVTTWSYEKDSFSIFPCFFNSVSSGSNILVISNKIASSSIFFSFIFKLPALLQKVVSLKFFSKSFLKT